MPEETSGQQPTWGDHSILVEVREPGAWRVVASSELYDPFGSHFLMIIPHPDANHIALWAAAGQDGQCLFGATRTASALKLERVADLSICGIPSFNRSGDQFLIVADYNELRQYQFPNGRLLAKMRWPFDDMHNQIGDEVLFVDQTRALLPSTADKLYLVDLAMMAIVDEVSFSGLNGNARLHQLPDGRILSVHRTGLTDTILTWRMP